MNCRSCNHVTTNILDFGPQYLAGNFFKLQAEALNAQKYPLRLNICEACSLLQIEKIPKLTKFFHNDYNYLTGNIPGMVNHFKDYADWIRKTFSDASLILEFGCNDGTLLQFLQKNNFIVTGMDASENVVACARDKGLDVELGFFGNNSAIYKNEQFDLITCSNVYAHVEKVSPLTSEAWRTLKQNGVFLIEVHNAKYLMPNQFDSIYHEHSIYYDSISISNHLNQNGFKVVATFETDMHGSGLRIVAQKTHKTKILQPDTSSVENQILQAQKVRKKITLINEFIGKKFLNRSVDIFGVAGRAQMFYHLTDLNNYVVRAFDDSESRQGRYIVGSKVLISNYNEENGDILLITAWNYASDIIEKVGRNYKEIYTMLPEIKKWK
tara:strand:+ start:101 stop:1246 length:1146 start_codon:yes stop_codon:yes gene_type:complete